MVEPFRDVTLASPSVSIHFASKRKAITRGGIVLFAVLDPDFSCFAPRERGVLALATYWAAFTMRSATSSGWESIATWPEGTSIISAFADFT